MRLMKSVDNPKVTFGTGLAGVIIVHVTAVDQFVALGAGAEEARKAEGYGASLFQAFGIWSGFPMTEWNPLKTGCRRVRPPNQADLKAPPGSGFDTAEEGG